MALAPLAQTLLITAGQKPLVLELAVTVPGLPPAPTLQNTRINSTRLRANNSALAATFHTIEQRLVALGG